MSRQEPAEPITRMKSGERREQILSAATAVFGSRGYYGTTTDDIARGAGVSQPYVVRMFGTKEKLFIEVLERTLRMLLATFRSAIAESPDMSDRPERMGLAYSELLSERGLMMTLGQAFMLGAEPRIGAVARRGFAEVWELLRTEAGFDTEQAHTFLANGMLINTVVGLRLTEEFGKDEEVTAFLRACFPAKIETLLDLAPRKTDAW
jgi:AcrR family transcriptional regulator